MMIKFRILLLALVSFFVHQSAVISAEQISSSSQDQQSTLTVQMRYERISSFIGTERYGEGGQVVLRVAAKALEEKNAAGEGLLVGLEDVWSHSLQEGLALFNKPDALWGKTTAEETSDMIGQTTIGPWQMTLRNIRHTYGKPYGVKESWTDVEIYEYCRQRPIIQAKMIIDYIQQSYETFGKRSPYAIQRYFWLEPFVKGELGQSEDWTKIVVAKPPTGGTWKDLTPEMKADTGFYAKQILLGTSYTNSGLLFWLQVTSDQEGLHETLRTWRDQKRIIIAPDDAPENKTMTIEGVRYMQTNQPGGFAISEDDVIYYKDSPEINEAVREALRLVMSLRD